MSHSSSFKATITIKLEPNPYRVFKVKEWLKYRNLYSTVTGGNSSTVYEKKIPRASEQTKNRPYE